MIADSVLGNIKENKIQKQQINVPFEWFELEKRRISKTAEDGTAIGVCIQELIKDGDILAETEEAVYVAAVVPSHLIKIHVSTMEEMGRLGFELGNRHLSLQISEHEVKVPFDQPTFEYLQKLGFDAEEVTEQFTDFVVCKAHGHSHGEEGHSHHHEKKHTHNHETVRNNQEARTKGQHSELFTLKDMSVSKENIKAYYYMF